MTNVCVVGSLNVDLVTQTWRMPENGETIQGGGFDIFPGGKGANQSVAAARLGANVRMIGCIGMDSFGALVINNLKRNQVSIQGITKLPKTSTGVATVILSEGDNRIILASGANHQLNVDMVDCHKHLIEQSDVILLQNEIPLEVNTYVMKAFQGKAKIIFNAAPALKMDKELFPFIDILIVNEHECAFMADTTVTDEKGALAAASNFMELGCKSVIVTLGSRGAFFCSSEKTGIVQGIPMDAVDTTGAGDTFCGAVAASVNERTDMEDICNFANHAAALSVLKKGAQTSMPTRREVDDLVKRKGM